MNLPELYAMVCEKVPEAKVPPRPEGFQRPSNLVHDKSDWMLICDGSGRRVRDDDAEAMILKHWLGMLPPYFGLNRGADLWWVANLEDDGFVCKQDTTRKSPVEAIAAYLLDQAG